MSYNRLQMVVYVRKLVWDEWNLKHIRRHQVNPEEVKEVVLSNPLALKAYKKARVALIGETVSGRILKVILKHQGNNAYYPVTAHNAAAQDVALYKRIKGGEKT